MRGVYILCILTVHLSCRKTRYYLLVFWSILMSIFTLMAFAIPDPLSDEKRMSLVYIFSNASGAIKPAFITYWREGSYPPVLYTFGSVHLILSIWMVLEYFIINWPNFRLPSFFYYVLTRYAHMHVANGVLEPPSSWAKICVCVWECVCEGVCVCVRVWKGHTFQHHCG